MQLTKDFATEEFACHCGCGQGAGKVGVYLPHMNFPLVSALQKLRDLLGPVIIVSGARCSKENKRVGGAVASAHLTNLAADIASPGRTTKQIYEAILKIEAFEQGGIGIGHGIVHVDVGPKRRWSYDKQGKVIRFSVPR